MKALFYENNNSCNQFFHVSIESWLYLKISKNPPIFLNEIIYMAIIAY